MSQTSIQAIQAMVAPVVLITSAGILAGGISTMYGSVNDRMRSMTVERLTLLKADAEGIGTVDGLARWPRERVTEIDAQLPMLLVRHHQLHHALLSCYSAVLGFVLGVGAIALSVAGHSSAFGTVALLLVLVGTATLLVGLSFAGRSVLLSQHSVDYEVHRVMALGQPTP